MKKIIALLLVLIITMSFVGCSIENMDISDGSYKIVEMDYSSNGTYVLVNIDGKLERAEIYMSTPMDDIDSLIGSYIVVKEHEVIKIRE